MKRTTLVLDEALPQEATRVLGEKTYSATVNRALQDAIRTKRIQSIGNFVGKRLWEGDLAEDARGPAVEPPRQEEVRN